MLYADTSALVPLAIDEPSSSLCRRLWNESDDVVTVHLTYVEAAAAFAHARRLQRLNASTHRVAVQLLEQLWPQMQIVQVNGLLVQRAANLAHDCALRGYDAVHCAAAELLEGPDLVVASGDRQLLRACASLGLATADISKP